MNLKLLVSCFFSLNAAFLLSCTNAKKISKCSVEPKKVVQQITTTKFQGYTAPDTLIRNAKGLNLLDNYNASCKLNLNLEDNVVEAYRATVFGSDSMGERTILTIEAIKFNSEKYADKVFRLIEPKVRELSTIPREDLGDFCVWQFEAHIHNVQIKDCTILLINKQGSFSADILNYFYNYLENTYK